MIVRLLALRKMRSYVKVSSDENDVVLTTRGTVGNVGLYDKSVSFDQMRINSGMVILRPDITALRPRFLYWLLRSPIFSTQVERILTGSAQPQLPIRSLNEMKLILPPLSEQTRIAGILDKADAIRRKRKQAIGLTEQFLRSTFLEMFGDPVRNTKRFPTRELKDIATVNRGKFTPRPRNDPKYYGGNYPFIQTGDIANSDKVVQSYSQTLNEIGIKVSRAFPIGTVVIAIVGATIGETAILGFESYAPDSVIGIQPTPKVCTSEFLEFLLRFWKSEIRARAPDTARANINLDTLKPIPIPLAPFEHQEKFSSVYQKIVELPDKQTEGLDDLFNSLVQRAFRGEL